MAVVVSPTAQNCTFGLLTLTLSSSLQAASAMMAQAAISIYLNVFILVT